MTLTPDQMDLEADRCARAGDRVVAAVWRARAACTRAGWIHPDRFDARQLALAETLTADVRADKKDA